MRRTGKQGDKKERFKNGGIEEGKDAELEGFVKRRMQERSYSGKDRCRTK